MAADKTGAGAVEVVGAALPQARWRFIHLSGGEMRPLFMLTAVLALLALLFPASAGDILRRAERESAAAQSAALLIGASGLSETGLAAAAVVLRGQPEIGAARLLSRAEKLQRLGLWLELGEDEDLPLPHAFAITLEPDALDDLAALKERLERIWPDSANSWRFVHHQAAAARLVLWARIAAGGFILAGLVLLACLLAASTLAVRASLAAHDASFALLHALGAEDRFLLRRFAWRFLLYNSASALAGVFCGWLVLAAVRWMTTSGQAAGVPVSLLVLLPWPDRFLLAAIPLIAGFCAYWTARRQLLTRLEHQGLAG